MKLLRCANLNRTKRRALIWRINAPKILFVFMSEIIVIAVWLSVTFVHCAQTAEDIDRISFAYYDSSVSLPDRVEIWPTSFYPSSPKWPTSVDLSVGRSETFDGKFRPNA